ncbi:MAG: SAM-dependent methyltransferase [Gammaproteobacteria bacterium]|nr:SAM-dependent methyltransferase [Gammaproteobacteria bacterium]
MVTVTELPAPGADEQALSDALSAQICQAITDNGGAIPFSHFMELCLYAPGLGYYSAGLRKFGAGGDFVTAPEISPLFGACIARSCAAVLGALDGGDILEFGAGSGRLAVDLLAGLDTLECLPQRYFILERSAELKQRQQQLLQAELPELFERVVWIDCLPEQGFRGVMLGNEVLDAMAVERFRWRGEEAEQYFVTRAEDGFAWQTGPVATDELRAGIARIARESALPDGYVSELNTSLQPWLQSVAASLQAGMILLIDYGYPRSEYYHEQRSSGTLLCHYRQRAHADVLRWPGLQDITAHVDFTAVAEAAVTAELAVSGYTTQSYFLLDCGLDSLLQAAGPTDDVDYLRQVQQAKTLILPGEMGERFQSIALTRELDIEIPGFRMQDFRYRL